MVMSSNFKAFHSDVGKFLATVFPLSLFFFAGLLTNEVRSTRRYRQYLDQVQVDGNNREVAKSPIKHENVNIVSQHSS